MTKQLGVMADEELELLDFMLDESARPITFIAMFDRDDIPEAVRTSLRKAAPMIKRGARPQTSPLPLTREVNMRNPFSFAGFPSWKRVFADKSKEAQARVYGDVAFRNQFREELKNPVGFGNWSRITVHEVQSPGLKRYEGKTVAELAAEQGKDGVDAFLDLTLAPRSCRTRTCCWVWATAARTSTCCATRAIRPTCSAPGCASARC